MIKLIKSDLIFIILYSIIVGILIPVLVDSVYKLDTALIIFVSLTIFLCVLSIWNHCKCIKILDEAIHDAVNVLIDENISLQEENLKLKSICDTDII